LLCFWYARREEKIDKIRIEKKRLEGIVKGREKAWK
jgi:hypothetical protein